MNEDSENDSSSTSQILEMIRLYMQESKRHQGEDMEYCFIQAEECHIQLEEDQEEWCIQMLRTENSKCMVQEELTRVPLTVGNSH